MSTARPTLTRMRHLLLGSALVCLVVALFSLPAGPVGIAGMVAELGPAHWAAAMAAAGLAFLLRFLRWHFLVRRAAGAVPLGSSGLIFSAGLAMALTPGKLGETLKAVELARRFDVPLARGMPVVAVELTTDLLAMSLVTAGLFGFVYPGARWIAGVGLVVAALLTAALTSPALAGGIARLLPAGQAAAKLAETPALVRRAVGWPGLALATLLAALAHGAKGLAAVIVVAGLGAGLAWHQAVFVYVAPTLAGALVMLPSSLGAAELGMAALIHDMATPVPTLAAAAAASLAIRLITLWLPLAIGGLALLVLRARPLAVPAA